MFNVHLEVMPDTAQRRSTVSQTAVWLTRGQLVLVMCIALALLLASATYGYQQGRRNAEARQLMTHTLLVLKQALELENSAILMESNHRAYLISGQPGSLARRDADYLEAVQLASELTTLVDRDPAQRQRVRQGMDVLHRRYTVMRQTSKVTAKSGLWAAQAHFKVPGDGSIEPVRAALSSMRLEEQRVLDESIPIFERGLARFNSVLIYGTGLAFVILIAAGMALLRELTRADHIITQRKADELAIRQLNRELGAQAEQLLQSNRELESFTYSVSHDLRAPLRHIDGFARMLAEDAADQLKPESQRFLQVIIASARRMGLLIDDLLAFSRLGRKPMAWQQIDMQAMVDSVVGEIRADRNTALQIETSGLPSAGGDPALLRQVWANLLSNAVKYSAPRGDQAHIVVTGERSGEYMTYQVRDNGVGFDMRYADKLFGVFQRLHPQDQFEGTGVGLAIVQRIVSRHGGKVSATAEPDHGACFTFDLPISEVVA